MVPRTSLDIVLRDYLLPAALFFLVGVLTWAIIFLTITTQSFLHNFDQQLTQFNTTARDLSTSTALTLHQLTTDSGSNLSQANRTLARLEADANHQLTAFNSSVSLLSSATSTSILSSASALQLATSALESNMQTVTDTVSASGRRLNTTLDTFPSLVDSSNVLVKHFDDESVKVLRDTRLTLTETGRAAGEIQRSMPQLIVEVDKIAQNSDRATNASAQAAEETARTMHNLAVATRPLPWPMRIFFQVAPGLAGIASGVAGGLAATGAFH